ncbi:hypothetical protein LTR57_012900 [Friedmanniomyces endolithicus]|nr:hypothetical protein LTR57_012900 [Friedmanniomyces endolithicus]
MPLELHALQESDMGVAYELMWETFKPDIMGLMYPDGINDAVREWSNSTSLASWRKDPERYKKNKVIDTDLPDNDPFGKIVGVADWEFYPKYRTKEEREKSSAENEKDGLPPLINGTMMKEFIGQLGEAKEEQLGGKPFVYLHILATHPKHHRRGVGAMHLRWGFEQAEKLGLPVYLESSPMGRPLYARNGFEIKAETLGAEGAHVGRVEAFTAFIMATGNPIGVHMYSRYADFAFCFKQQIRTLGFEVTRTICHSF